jgi:outer membrane lipoprotein-sorting protein
LVAGNVSGIVQIQNGGTGSSTKNFVDLTSDQTIGGYKSFTGQLSGNGSGLTNVNGVNITPGTVGREQLAPDVIYPQRSLLGSLRWDLLQPRKTFAAGINPAGIAFDGASIWVINGGNNNVMKFRAKDGALLGTFPVGTSPRGIVFDGANVWVTNLGSNNVTKLRASDGQNIGTFVVGTAPMGIAFDGSNIWVANTGSSNVTRLRASDGMNVGTTATVAVPTNLAFDGTLMWVTHNTTAHPVGLTRIRASDGGLQGQTASFAPTWGIAFDGEFMWFSRLNDGFVSKFPVVNVGPVLSFDTGSSPTAVVTDGTHIYVSCLGDGTVRKFRPDGTLLDLYPSMSAPTGMAFDGANVWVTNSTGSSVVRLPPAFR